MVYQPDSRQVRTHGNISLTTRTNVKPRHYPGDGGLIASAGGPPRAHHPSQRHIAADAGSSGADDPPERGLAPAVVRLETSRSRGEVARVPRGLDR